MRILLAALWVTIAYAADQKFIDMHGSIVNLAEVVWVELVPSGDTVRVSLDRGSQSNSRHA
jgi:acyl dehydratase